MIKPSIWFPVAFKQPMKGGISSVAVCLNMTPNHKKKDRQI